MHVKLLRRYKFFSPVVVFNIREAYGFISYDGFFRFFCVCLVFVFGSLFENAIRNENEKTMRAESKNEFISG